MGKTIVNLTVIILAKNEQDRIIPCIESVSWADEIIVINNNSSDDTAARASKYVSRVINSDATDFSVLRNLGAKHARGTWILYIDADEQVPQMLKDEIVTVMQQKGPMSGYYLKRQNYYLSHLWPVTDTMQRLFLHSKFKQWTGSLHETAVIDGAFATLQHALIHHTHRTLEGMVDKTNEWSNVEATLRFRAGHPPVVWWRFLIVMITGFWNSFVIQRGYAAGVVGWIESIYQAFSWFITYAKLWELQRKTI